MPLTQQNFLFGIELEFALATTKPPEHSSTSPHINPTPNTTNSTKKVDFLTPFELKYLTTAQYTRRIPEYITADMVIYLRQRGILAFPEKSAPQGRIWSIGNDISVLGPEVDPTRSLYADQVYTWVGMEVRSPPMPCTVNNLEEIEFVCELIRERYVVETNISTGLHVHISGGEDEVISFPTLKKLFAFLWAFEPQLDTLHPPHRQTNDYCKSLRRAAALSEAYYQNQGIVPSAAQAVIDIRRTKTPLELCAMMTRPKNNPHKGTAYNAVPARGFLESKVARESGDIDNGEADYPTIEFRQHEGTLEGARISLWITTVLGIVDYCERTDDRQFYEFVGCMTRWEKWEKRGDESDVGNEERYGPVLAERDYTVVDLLKEISLVQLAEYYDHRLFPLVGRGRRFGMWTATGKEIVWEYEDQKDKLTEGEYDELHHRRILWGLMQGLVASSKALPDLEPCFDPEESVWPKHKWNAPSYTS